MNIIYIITSRDIEILKQKARKLKKETGISHHEALDQIAQKYGLHHWHHVTEMASLAAPVEEAFKNGLVLAYDQSEADFEMEPLEEIHEGYIEKFCKDDLWKIYLAMDDDEEAEASRESEDEEDLREDFEHFMMDFVFLRFTGDKLPETIDEVMDMAQKFGMWLPWYVWFKGKIYNTYGLPAKDNEGNIVGVRF